jgi:dCMP deaminase
MPFADIDKRFMELASAAMLLATCRRRKVGAVLVHERQILAVGQNRAPYRSSQCADENCRMVGGHCNRTIHAEAYTVLQVGQRNLLAYSDRPEPLTLYVTTSPCWACANIIAESGIKRVVYASAYADKTHDPAHNNYHGPLIFLGELGISVVEFVA